MWMAGRGVKNWKESECVLPHPQEANSQRLEEASREHARVLEEKERRHGSELRALEERLAAEKEAWQENVTRRQETAILAREREMREALRQERDKVGEGGGGSVPLTTVICVCACRRLRW